MTHDELVDRAARWLLNTRRCKVVIHGAKPISCREHPDVIGWLPQGQSIVIEAKISSNDYRADWRKQWRKSSTGMGLWKYYITPPGLISGRFRRDGCGLLETKGRIVKVVCEAEPRQIRDWSAEICLLLSNLGSRERTIINTPEVEDIAESTKGDRR